MCSYIDLYFDGWSESSIRSLVQMIQLKATDPIKSKTMEMSKVAL